MDARQIPAFEILKVIVRDLGMITHSVEINIASLEMKMFRFLEDGISEENHFFKK